MPDLPNLKPASAKKIHARTFCKVEFAIHAPVASIVGRVGADVAHHGKLLQCVLHNSRKL